MKKNILAIAAYLATALPIGGVAGGVLSSCSDDNFGPDPSRDWDNTTSFFASTDEVGFQTYYNPSIGRCGDPMPFFDPQAQDFKVLYLQEYDNNATYNFHPFWGVKTTDGANYQSIGEVLPTAESTLAQDAALGTGCAYYSEADHLYYIYYTGHNGNCTNREVIMRATSPDFKNWTKDELWTLKGDDYGYSTTDFRDPQIFVGDDGMYHMVIVSNLKFAEFKSSDLKNWQHVGQFNMIWDRMCECPDIFKMGNYWYLVYSEAYRAPWSRKVKYMMATSWEGLKECFSDPGAHWPQDGHEGVLDSRAFYAGKTASNGTDRYIWGWCPFRSGTTIKQHTVRMVESNGCSSADPMSFSLSGNDAYALFNRLDNHNHISFTVTTNNNWDKFGISFVRGTDSKKYYTLVVNPEWEDGRKINFEEEGEEGKGFVEGIDGYNFQRPSDNVYNIDIYTDNSVLVMYINDVCAYTQRIYGIQKNCWSINNYGGNVEVSNVEVSLY